MGGLALVLMAMLAQVESSGLAPAEGRDAVWAVCTACHTAEIIVASHMSRKTWDSTITWMEETQGLSGLEPDVRTIILDYLEKTQGLEEVDGAESPWASPTYRPNPIW